MKHNSTSNITSASTINSFRNILGPIILAIAIILSFTISTTTYSEYTLLSILVYIASLFILYREKFPYSHLHIAIYLFIVYIFINPFWSINFSRSLFHILILCQIPLLFLLFSTDRMQRSWGNYLLLLAVPALVASTWGIIEYMQTDQSGIIILYHRIDGFLYDSNSFAAIQYIFSILLFSLLYNHTPKVPFIQRGIWLIQFLVITTLLLTLSRSGIMIWFLFIFIISTYSLIKKIRKLKKYILLHLIIALLSYTFLQILVANVDQPLVRGDLPGGLVSSSLNGRLEIWKPTIRLIAERPLFGWGLDSFVSLYPSIREEYYSAGKLAHNDYLQFTLEGGLILLLFLLMFLGWNLYILLKLFTRKPGKTDATSGVELTLMLIANIALLLHSTINFSFYIIQLCILSGIIFARSYYLSVNIGLVKQPTFINLTKTTKRVSTLILTIVMITILYRSISGLLFIDLDKYALTRSLSSNKVLLNIFSVISPLDHPSSTRLVVSLFTQLNTVSNTREKKQIVDFSISSLEALTKEYPYEPANFSNLGYLMKFAYLKFPEYHDKYKHYENLWMKSIEIDPAYIPPYLKLYDDLSSKNEYLKALSILEGIIPTFSKKRNSMKDILLVHDLLIKLAEKTADDLLPLYKKLSLSAKQGDNKAYYDTFREIKLRLKSRKITPNAIHPPPLLPQERGLE